MRRAIAWGTLLVLTACAEPAPAPSDPAHSSSVVTTASTTTVPTTLPTTTVASVTSTSTAMGRPGPGPRGVEEYLPAEVEGAPVAVMVHGGGWVGGHPSSIAPLGRALADDGMLVFNASYTTALTQGAFPRMFEDIACAVRYARHRAAELGASDHLLLIGHSAGAHIASAVALSADAFVGDCDWKGSSTPDQLVGLAGVYRLDSVAPIMEAMLGGDRQTVPEAWEAVDPYSHLEAASGVVVTLVHGAADDIVPTASSQDLADALTAIGVTVAVQIVDGADHVDLIDPTITADLVGALVP